MTRLVWSREKPKEPGRYWWRVDSTCEGFISEVWFDEDKESFVDEHGIKIHLLGGEWAGPLLEPEEA